MFLSLFATHPSIAVAGPYLNWLTLSARAFESLVESGAEGSHVIISSSRFDQIGLHKEEVRPAPMPQPEAARINGSWKALFICPNSKIIKELGPLLHHFFPAFTSHEVSSYPTRHQITDLLAAQQPSLCFLEVSEPSERGLALIPELL